MKYTYLALIFLSFLSVSCNNTSKKEVGFTIAYNGALKDIMHKGDITAKASLSDFEGAEHFYALGAFENLKGEIQIFDSTSFNTSVKNDTLTIDSSFDKNATLLVYAKVEKWNTFKVPDSVVDKKQFETYVFEVAKQNNININKPFPFLVSGTARKIDWHVIDWKDGDTEHSHAKHISSGLNGTLKNKNADFLGFYSNAHHTIFTHHSTNIHTHFKLQNNSVAGHVDDFLLGDAMTLKLPKVD
ncbi:acetolactate decarboxylase [Patiriisocius hiemis]|uniref:Acetolactate decarboxylase n=1 Tax=Patiriisocius hiemis TaxID=3075604 RepID=A0ABU2YCS9_9FLAO|nr:acetolactate decarboxylase [Constantimarinum sp. W242]MDT0555479.1 acetolactate decarboxylase [Constantimarinum sp. W242]